MQRFEVLCDMKEHHPRQAGLPGALHHENVSVVRGRRL